jgi:hypothetical protein
MGTDPKKKEKIPPDPLPKNPKRKTNLSPLIKWWAHFLKKVL